MFITEEYHDYVCEKFHDYLEDGYTDREAVRMAVSDAEEKFYGEKENRNEER